MRLKFKPWAKEHLNQSKYTVDAEQFLKLNPNKIVRMEIGIGKGDFIIGHAQNNPDIFYFGVEKYPSVLALAEKKVAELELKNVMLVDMDALNLESAEYLKGNCEIIYLNFSDPWPKSRHEKRRLTSKRFLDIYKQLLTKDGHIEFKTDNVGLFEYSVESMEEYGMDLISIDRDLENTPDNIQTEYEKKFRAKGTKINKLIAKYKKGE